MSDTVSPNNIHITGGETTDVTTKNIHITDGEDGAAIAEKIGIHVASADEASTAGTGTASTDNIHITSEPVN
ncbi:hypothetical protein ACH4A8_12510 [Streptomyces vietnamensis]|uniref:hypothetical protein n=1 Tax=Streptomyces vietnamensis TaxID=362257 RepID=UPI0037AD64BF